MMFRVWLPAALLFGTGVLTGLGLGGLGVGRLPPVLPAETRLPGLAEVVVATPGPDRPPRAGRPNGAAMLGLRSPGAGRLEQFKRVLGELELEGGQRERIEAHFRETHDRLRALLKPLHPEATRELRALRQRILVELSPEQRAHFERQSLGNERSERARVRPSERRD